MEAAVQASAGVGYPAWHTPGVVSLGVICGGAAGMNRLAGSAHPEALSQRQIAMELIGGAMLGAALMWLVSWGISRLVNRPAISAPARRRFFRISGLGYVVGLGTLAGAWGVQFIGPVIAAMALAFVAGQGAMLAGALSKDERGKFLGSMPYLAFLFFISGFAALIYQIVWQRALFAAYGVNIESITIIVSLFMFGLGVGAMLGGALARRFPDRAPLLFLLCEAGVGLFGLASLPLIHGVARQTLGGSMLEVSAAVFALLCVPTLFMGATLPILVGHLNRHYHNVGKSVGILYFINTLGSAAACFLTADLLFVLAGQQASVYCAAACNVTVGILVWRYAMRAARTANAEEAAADEPAELTGADVGAGTA